MIPFMTSSARSAVCDVLTETQIRAKKQSGQLVLVNASERIRDSFKLVAMDNYFEHYSDITEAVGSF